MQLIADYYAFASPSVTGQWRVQVQGDAWQLGFRGGELVFFDTPVGDSDLLGFLLDIGRISESNLQVLRGFPPDGARDAVISDLVGGSEKLLDLRRKHALHAIGHLLCRDVDRADFSDLSPQQTRGLGLEALALPYIALRLQAPEVLQEKLAQHVQAHYRLSRNTRIPVAGLQLDREALNIAKQFTKPNSMAAVIKANSAGAEALVTYATLLTLLGCDMLCKTEATPQEYVESPKIAPQERIRPPSMKIPIRRDAEGFERMPTGTAPPIDSVPVRDSVPVAAPAPPAAPPAPAPRRASKEVSVAALLRSLDNKTMTDAETMLETLEESEQRKDILRDFINANDPNSTDPGGAMIAALGGLQAFTEAKPEDHLGPLLLSRIYAGADNPALAKIFAEQAQRLGGHTQEVADWKVNA
ncbi:MAG: hypothetical protein OSB21_05610 [Myxococcota bacterium]|nr:hypothetical protein [Myxococcota bacterium]